MNYNLLIIFIIIGLLFLYIKITSNVFIQLELFDINTYKKIMLNNDEKNYLIFNLKKILHFIKKIVEVNVII